MLRNNTFLFSSRNRPYSINLGQCHMPWFAERAARRRETTLSFTRVIEYGLPSYFAQWEIARMQKSSRSCQSSSEYSSNPTPGPAGETLKIGRFRRLTKKFQPIRIAAPDNLIQETSKSVPPGQGFIHDIHVNIPYRARWPSTWIPQDSGIKSDSGCSWRFSTTKQRSDQGCTAAIHAWHVLIFVALFY